MSDAQRKELDAFISFFATFDLSRPPTTVADLSDGAVLFEVLASLCVASSGIRSLHLTTGFMVGTQTIFVSRRVPQTNRPTTGFSDSAL